MAVKNIAGLQFGRLTVVELAGRNKHGSALWRCLCSCGQEKIINGNQLQTGKTQSCGCLRREVHTAIHRKRLVTHGESYHPLYPVWQHMMDRCHNPRSKFYSNYGGRGIAVCSRWHDAAKFIEDMDNRPTPKHTIERIDNDGNYEPGNCRWATRKEQNRNTRANRLITHDGVTKPLGQWAEETGINEGAIRDRIDNLGWSVEKALTTPINACHRRRGLAAHPKQ